MVYIGIQSTPHEFAATLKKVFKNSTASKKMVDFLTNNLSSVMTYAIIKVFDILEFFAYMAMEMSF